MELLTTPEVWISFITLALLEIVLVHVLVFVKVGRVETHPWRSRIEFEQISRASLE